MRYKNIWNVCWWQCLVLRLPSPNVVGICSRTLGHGVLSISGSKVTLLVPRVSESLSWKLTLQTSALCLSSPAATLRSSPIPTLSRGINDISDRWRNIYLRRPLCPPINKILKTYFWFCFSPCVALILWMAASPFKFWICFQSLWLQDFGIDIDCVSLCLLTS